MGHVSADLTLYGRKRTVTIRKVMIDTGASYTVIDELTWNALGLVAAKRPIRLELGNGKLVRARGAGVSVKVAGRTGLTSVLSFRGAIPVIGVETLEMLGLAVDPRRHRIVATRPSAKALYYGTVPPGRRG